MLEGNPEEVIQTAIRKEVEENPIFVCLPVSTLGALRLAHHIRALLVFTWTTTIYAPLLPRLRDPIFVLEVISVLNSKII